MSLKSRGFLRNNAATILTCVGAVGVVGTAVLTSKAAIKANDILKEAENEKGEELTKLEKLNVVTPVYIPAILLGVTTVSCIFGANVFNKKKQAALVSAYGVLDHSYKEYRNKVKELYGEDAAKEIEEEIFKDHNYDDNGNKLLLYYDDYSKRYFEATAAQVKRAEYEVNRNLMLRDYAYLDEFYDELGLEPIDDYSSGWSTVTNFDMYWQTWIDFSHSKKILDDGRECIVIYILEEPMLDFENY